jgi:hypothetical protein
MKRTARINLDFYSKQALSDAMKDGKKQLNDVIDGIMDIAREIGYTAAYEVDEDLMENDEDKFNEIVSAAHQMTINYIQRELRNW